MLKHSHHKIVPDVPGPNAYNIPPGKQYFDVTRSGLTPSSESSLESYKRGAFLEKTDRFSKEKPLYIPGTCLAL